MELSIEDRARGTPILVELIAITCSSDSTKLSCSFFFLYAEEIQIISSGSVIGMDALRIQCR